MTQLDLFTFSFVGFDCGVFRCMFCDFISKDYPLVFKQAHIKQYRDRIALSIMKNCTIDDENADLVEILSSCKIDRGLQECKFTKKAEQIVSKSKWAQNQVTTPDCIGNMNTLVECEKNCNGGMNCLNKRIQTGLWKKVETEVTQGSGNGLFLMVS